MTKLMEIESAIETLPAQEVQELAQWLEEYQTMINASEQVFSMLDAEESQEKKWDHPR